MKTLKKFWPAYLPLLFIVLTFCSNSGTTDRDASANKPSPAPIPAVNYPDSLVMIADDSHDNLQVFLFASSKDIPHRDYITLSEALEKNYAVVNETGSVNELSIKNTSNHYIFIHAGDIVKGGRQDRTLSFDVIIPPKADNIPLISFCVEHGRWTQRGTEAVGNFSANTSIISSRDLKVASKMNADQSQVWNKVSEQQVQLNEKITAIKGQSVNVTENASASSLQLTLENKDLEDIRKKYKDKLFSMLEKNNTAIGYAYAINGEVYGMDIYSSKKLFSDLWNKLLDAIIVEAVSKVEKDKTFEKTTENQILSMMEKAAKGEKTSREVNKSTTLIINSVTDAALFTTIDNDLNNWVHKNYISIDTTQINNPGKQIYYNNQINRRNLNNNDIQQIIID